MLFLAILGFASAQGAADLGADPRLDKHVSYRAVAANAKSAIAGLAQATGLPLAAGGTIQSEILLLRLDDVPLREAMVRLGHAVAATWVTENGTYYLSRTDADVAKRQAADTARLVAGIKKEMAKRAKAAAAAKPLDAATAKDVIGKVQAAQNPKPAGEAGGPSRGMAESDLAEVRAASPAGRLADRVFAQLDPEVLARVPIRRRSVFSTNPTRMELPLHLELGDAIQVFEYENGLIADQLAMLPEQDRFHAEVFQGGLLADSRSKLPPAKLNVVVSRLDNFMSGIGIEVHLYDTEGTQLAYGKIEVQIDPDMPSDRELMADPNEQKLAISPEDMTIMQVLGSTQGGKSAKVTVLPEAIRARLLRPELHEPLSSFASSLLLGAAETRHLNVVADLPDAYVILGATPGFTGLPTAASILKLAMSLPPSIGPVTLDDKWLEIAGGQAVPDAIMAHRTNREALGQLFTTTSDGVLTIEGLARYAFVTDAVPDDFLFLLLGPLLFPGSDDNGGTQWRTYKVIGSLMHWQAEAPLKSGRIPLSALDAGTLALLENVVFFQETGGFTTRQSRGGIIAPGSEEPCEFLPNGLPRDGYIDVTLSEVETVFSTGARAESVKPSQLAFYQEMQEHPDRFGAPGPRAYDTSSKFRIGTTRKLQLHLQFAEGISKDLSVEEKHIGTASPVPFSGLPKAFQDDYQRSKDSFKQTSG